MPARSLPLFLAVGLLWPAARLSAADTPTVVLAVRHAEKASATAEDPSLSPAGQRRAQALAHAVSAAGVDAIYVTQFKRTQETVAPLAAKLKLTPIQHPAKDTAGLVAAIRTKWSGQTVVVSGHSNTVNEVVKTLTGTPVEELPDEQFDNLFVIVVPPGGAGQFTQLKYGAPTPEETR
jgi:2,3-bisphosphoglycerate-dependent phosphoglycerate mutase